MKTPFVTKAQIEEIVKTYPTPFHIYDEKGIRENARKLKQAFAWNKGYKEYFAVKATPNPTILKILKEEGCGTDCSSYTELLMSEKMGITGSDIMFSSNDTPAEEFVLAKKLGANINLDDYTHVQFLKMRTRCHRHVCSLAKMALERIMDSQIMTVCLTIASIRQIRRKSSRQSFTSSLRWNGILHPCRV